MKEFTHEQIEHSFARVGEYLFHWADMEFKLNTAIEKAMGLNAVQSVIINTNVNFYAKCHILSCLINLEGFSKEDTKKMLATIEALQRLSPDRNMVAHTAFFTSDKTKNAVVFFHPKAKGKAQFPKVTWTLPEFKKRYKRLNELTKELEELTKRLSYSRLAKALLKSPPPNLGMFAQNSLGLLALQL
jgi:hypothetical protein